MIRIQKGKYYIFLVVLLVTGMLSVGFSAFQNNLNVEDLLMHVRLQRDTRVTSKSIEASDGVMFEDDDYEKYNVSKIYGNITFDSTSSYVLYKIGLTNYGNVKMGLLDIDNNGSGIDYQLCDSNGNNCTNDFRTAICDGSDCTLGAEKDVYLKISPTTSGDRTIDLDLDFEPYNDITYDNVRESTNSFPTEIMSTDSFTITLTSKPEEVEVSGTAEVEYNKNTGVLIVSNLGTDLNITAKYLLTTVAQTSYTGSDPDNYVKFGNDLYRIITKENIDDGYNNTELRTKILSNTSIGSYPFDTYDNGNFDESSLYEVLNTTYYNSLSNTQKELIDTSRWFFTNNWEDPAEPDANKYYFVSHFALITASDFNNNSSWLNQDQFMMDICYGIGANTFVCTIENNTISQTQISNQDDVYPVTYLKTDVLVVGGSGTQADPYLLELSSNGLQSNPTHIEGRNLTVTGSNQQLVTVTNSVGTPYYSTSTALNSSNYSSAGSTTIPTASEVGNYTVYYYIPAFENIKAKSGAVSSRISGIKYTISYAKGTNVSAIGKTSDECTTSGTNLSCSVTLPTITPNAGYGNGKWSDGTNTFDPGASYTLSGNGTTLTAQASGNTYTATFYYWNGTQIATTTAQCTVSSGSTCDVTVPTAVSSSTGKYTGTYRGVNTSFSAMNTSGLVLSDDTAFYANYSSAVTNYYYNGTQYTSRTLYRNEYFSGNDTITAKLATANNLITNYTTETGPGNSVWTGLSTARDTTPEYNDVQSAANSNNATFYTVYTFNATFEGIANVATVNPTAKSCKVTTSNTSCYVYPPTVSTQNGNVAISWTESETGSILALDDPFTLSQNGRTYTINVAGGYYQNTTTLAYYHTLNEAFSAVANNQTIKVLAHVTETTDATLLSIKTGIILDLNDKQISFEEAHLNNYGSLEIRNDGWIVSESNDTCVYNYGTLTLKNNAEIRVMNNIVALNNSGTLIIDTGESGGVYSDDDTSIENSGTITINSGRISALFYGIYGHGIITINDGWIGAQTGIYLDSSSTVIMNGGELFGDNVAYEDYNNSTLTINGGSIFGSARIVYNYAPSYGIKTDGEVFINGGSIDAGYPVESRKTTMTAGEIIISSNYYATTAVTSEEFIMTGGRIRVFKCGQSSSVLCDGISSNTITFGVNDSAVSTSSPIIEVNGYGIVNSPSQLYFYDGIIKSTSGNSYSIQNGVSITTPGGYQVVKTLNNGVESAYLDRATYTATFYYWNGSAITTKTSQCTVTSGSSCAVTVPTEVSSSSAPNGGIYKDVTSSLNSMGSSSLNISDNTNYYVNYSKSVTNYYYNGTQYTSRSLYRNEYFSANDTMVSKLSTSNNLTSNYSTAVGPGNSVWSGLSTAQDTTAEYSSVQYAADSNSTTLYTIYTFNATFAAGTGVESVSSETGSCKVTTSNTSCAITSPTATLQSGYMNPIWTQSGTGTTYAISDPITVNTNNNTYTASAIAANYQNTTTNATYTSLNEAFSAVANNQTIKVLQDTNETVGATLASGKTGVKLDLNGKNIQFESISDHITINGSIEITGDGTIFSNESLQNNGSVTVSNGAAVSADNYGIINDGTLIINNASVGSYDASGIDNNGNVTINNGHVSGYGSGVRGSGTVTINGGTIGAITGIILENGGQLYLNDGNVSGRTAAISIDTGATANITGGSIDSSGSGAAVGISNYGTLYFSGGNISFTNNTDIYSYGIKNYGTANISGGSISVTGSKLNSSPYGIYNEGSLSVSGGSISTTTIGVAGYSYGIYSKSNSVTIGTNDSTISTTVPVIESKITNTYNGYGLYVANGTFNFYDGIIKAESGSGYAINRDPDNVPTGYQVVKTLNNGVESAYLDRATYTATFYYWNGSAITTKTSQCTVTSGSSCAVTVPTEVSSSTGQYGSSYANVSRSTNSLTAGSLTITENTTFYAYYSGPVTNYYYNGTQYTNRTLYRNEYYSASNAMSAKLSISQTSTANINVDEETGPGGSEWYGLSSGQDTNIDFDDVQEAADSNSSSLYSVYEFSATFAAGANITAVSPTHRECYVTYNSTSCSVLPPTVTPASGYMASAWIQSGTGTSFAISDPIIIDTMGYTYTASAITANYQNTTTNKVYATLNDAFSQASNNQTIKVLQDVTETVQVEIPSGLSVVLDLNSKIVTNNMLVTNNGTLNIIDSTGSGNFNCRKSLRNDGILILNEMSNSRQIGISNVTYPSGNGILNNGNLIIYNARVYGENNGIENNAGATLIMYDGTITGNNGVCMYNYGSATILGGSLTGNGYSAVTNYSGSTFTLGSDDETVSATSPSVTSYNNYGINSNTGSIFNMYDGVVNSRKGSGYAINRDPDNIPDGYQVVKVLSDGVESAYLRTPPTARFYYYDGSVITSKTATCTITSGNSCTVTIPSEVTSSIGQYGSAYAGVSTSTSSMSSSSLTISDNTVYYAYYSNPGTIYYPNSTSTQTSTTYYRNEFFTSNSAISSVIASNNTGTSNTTFNNVLSGYNFNGFATNYGTNTRTYTSLDTLASSSDTTVYAILDKIVSATIYYNAGSGNGTVSIDTKTTNSVVQYLRCTASGAELSGNSFTIPSAVSNSVGPNGEAYRGVSNSLNSMTTTSPTNTNTVFYAVYLKAITNYYFNNYYMSRTLYRNSYFDSNSSMKSVLATANNITTNYTTAAGPGSSVWSGLSTEPDTTVEYNTIDAAASSNSDTLYTVYTFNATFTAGTGIASVSSNSGSCKVTSSNDTCNITPPSVTTESGYTATTWTESDTGSTYAINDQIILSVNGRTYTASGIAYNYVNTTTGEGYATLNAAFSAASSNDTIRVVKSSISESATATLASGKTGIKLDLNGNTITSSASPAITNNGLLDIYSSVDGGILQSSGTFTITNNGTLTTNSTSNAHTLTIQNTSTATDARVINNTASKNTTLNTNTTITMTGATTAARPLIATQGTVTINGATLTNTASGNSSTYDRGISINGANGRIVMNSGTITTSGNAIHNASGTGTSTPAFEMTGGRVESLNQATINNRVSSTMSISGGRVEGGTYAIYTHASGNINISGTAIIYNDDSSNPALYNNAGAIVNITGGSVTGDGGTGIYNSSSGTINISGTGQVSGVDFGIDNDGIINITGSDAGVGSSFVAITSGGTLNISAGSVYGGSSAITGTGAMTITGGTITGNVSSAISISDGTLTLGTNDTTVSITSPLIQTNSSGNVYGVSISSNSTFNFYDGIIKSASGSGYAINRNPNNMPTNYQVVKSVDNGVESAVLGLPITATFHYNSNTTRGSFTDATTTQTCYLIGSNTSCTVEVPSVVTSSVGRYNSPFSGVATSINSMTNAIENVSGVQKISISANTNLYTFYTDNSTTNILIYRNASGDACSSIAYYRNEYYDTSTTMKSIIATSQNNMTAATITSSLSGYTLVGFNDFDNSNVTNIRNTTSNLIETTYHELYMLLKKDKTVYIYYNTYDSNNPGVVNINSINKLVSNYVYCQSRTNRGTLNPDTALTTAEKNLVINSKSKWGQAYAGSTTVMPFAHSLNSMTTTNEGISYKYDNYYAVYFNNVSIWQYNTSSGAWEKNTTSYHRNSFYTSTTTMKDVFATSITSTTNYTPTTGPGGSVFAGLSAQWDNPSGSNVANTADLTGYNTLYTIYTMSISYTKDAHITSISKTSDTCNIVCGRSNGPCNNTCNVTPPTASPEIGYSADLWKNLTTSEYTSISDPITVTTNNTTYQAISHHIQYSFRRDSDFNFVNISSFSNVQSQGVTASYSKTAGQLTLNGSWTGGHHINIGETLLSDLGVSFNSNHIDAQFMLHVRYVSGSYTTTDNNVGKVTLQLYTTQDGDYTNIEFPTSGEHESVLFLDSNAELATTKFKYWLSKSGDDSKPITFDDYKIKFWVTQVTEDFYYYGDSLRTVIKDNPTLFEMGGKTLTKFTKNKNCGGDVYYIRSGNTMVPQKTHDINNFIQVFGCWE